MAKGEKYYIYKFVDEEEQILYVGKTKNLEQRLRNHIKDKKWIQAGVSLYCAETKNLTDMDIYETYYINKLKPKYNKFKTYDAEFTQNIKELNFTLYKTLNDSDLSIRNNTYKRNSQEFGKMWDNIYLSEDVNWNIEDFLYDTNIAKSHEFAITSIATSDDGFQEEKESIIFDFKMHDNSIIRIYVICNTEGLIEFPTYIYYEVFLPILQKQKDTPTGNENFLFNLDELLDKKGE